MRLLKISYRKINKVSLFEILVIMDFDLLTKPSRWCFPAFAYALFVGYLIIVTLSFDGKLRDGHTVTLKDKLLAALGELIWGVIILYILLLLCKNNMEMYAWAALLLPVLVHYVRSSLGGCKK